MTNRNSNNDQINEIPTFHIFSFIKNKTEMPDICSTQSKISILLFLAFLAILSVLYSIQVFDYDSTISGISSIYLENVRKFKESYPPMLIGAYESENRISVSVAALKPIGYI